MTTRPKLTFLFIIVVVAANPTAQALDSLQITSPVFASGGGTSSGGGYTFTDTLGETVVGTSSGGNHTFAAGFQAQEATPSAEATVDLQVTAALSPLVLTEGIAGDVTLSVSNRGPTTASAVQLAVSLPAGLPASAATSSAGICQVTPGNVICTVAGLSSNESFTVEVTVRPDFLAESSDLEVNLGNLSVAVGSTEADLNPADNMLGIPVTVRAQLDWGDAPVGFPVTAAEHGAYHRYSTNAPWLGVLWDNDGPTGNHSALANWDDTHGASDDEDGIVFPSPLLPGRTVVVAVTCSRAPGLLNAWADFNNNLSWADPGEQIFTNQPVTPGTNTLTFNVPATAVPSLITTRWRVNKAGGLSYTDYGGPGEVEDDVVRVLVAPRPTVTMSAGRFTLSFQTDASASYVVEYSDSLTPPDWKPLKSVAGSGDTVTVTDDTVGSARFYRIRIE